jgi:hypothetical protein
LRTVRADLSFSPKLADWRILALTHDLEHGE